MKNLVIVESPSKSKTIEKYLGKDYTVLSSKGHIRDLATYGTKEGLGVDIENNFEPKYTYIKGKKELVNDLKKQASKADKVYLATDPDREGEAISYHLASELGLDFNDDNRVVFNEITKDAILKAFKQPRMIDMSLVRSQETRRILDRIIGFKLSKLLRGKIQSKSAGRVQSCALHMIELREKEINEFKSEEYWTIDSLFNKNKIEVKASLAKVDNKKVKINNEDEANKIIERLNGSFNVSDIKKQVKKRSPKQPFITSTLQQEASSKLGFSSKRTMAIAQRLYEGVTIGNETKGLITYMRSDSYRLSNVFINAGMSFIEEKYGKDYKGFYNMKHNDGAQDAHEAIRPTDITLVPEDIKQYLKLEEYKLYRFIYYRALASLMAQSVNDTVQVTFTQNNIDFVCNGSVMTFDGFLKVYADYDSSNDIVLPNFEVGEEINAKKIIKEQHFTEPPQRYTEAKLIKAMEEEGIGRPSTYATIIETIQARGYVELKKANEKGKTKYFYPTEQGSLTDLKLQEFFSSIINVKYTAKMEKELDLIAEDQLNNVEFLREFYDKFTPLLDEANEKMEKKELEETGELCPLCGGKLVYRKGRYGKFISCINYPTCKFTKTIGDDSDGKLEETGEMCPECGSPLVYRKGRYGKFISCINYPTCKFTKKIVDQNKEQPEHTGIMCPECGAELLKRKSRFGTYFLGCSNYPKCKHIESLKQDKEETKKRKKKDED